MELIDGLYLFGGVGFEVRGALVTARVVIHDEYHVVQAIVNEAVVKRDGGPRVVGEVHGATEDEVFNSDGNPVRVAIKVVLVGVYHVDVQVAVAHDSAALVEVDAFDESGFAQFGNRVNLLRQRGLE